MGEQEWLECADPTAMLDFLCGKISERKARLCACAYSRQISHLPTNHECHRNAIEVAERYVDGSADARDLGHAHFVLMCHNHSVADHIEDALATVAVMATTAPINSFFCRFLVNGAHNVRHAATRAVTRLEEEPATAEAIQADLAREAVKHVRMIRDIFGNPCRPVAIDPGWLTWHDGTIPKIAQAIYAERRFADMPILADALEEAGCTDAAILDHCRQPGEHVRGCWVVDLLLGKT
jgi:hypothetical protein